MWVWVMIFAGHQLLCLQLTVWRRKSTLKQLREGVGLELVEMGIAFQQLHAMVVITLFIMPCVLPFPCPFPYGS